MHPDIMTYNVAFKQRRIVAGCTRRQNTILWPPTDMQAYTGIDRVENEFLETIFIL